MRTLSKRLNHWLNVGLVLTLLIGLLPPAPLAAASAPGRQTDEHSQFDSTHWLQSKAGAELIPIVSQKGNRTGAVAPDQDVTVPTYGLPSRTLALPFDFGHSTDPVSEASVIPGGAKAIELEGNTPATFSNLGQLPLSFVPNAGQLEASVRFQAHGLLGSSLFFAPDEVILALPGSAADSSSTHIPQPPGALRLRFEGTNPTPELVGGERLPGIVNYFIGNDPAQWQTNLPTYGNLVYKNLYPGINLHYNGTEGALKGTYIVAPGADPTRIHWRYEGAEQVRLDEATGNLLITLDSNPQAPIIEQVPIAWQEIDGQRVPVTSHYTVTDEEMIGLILGNYNPNLPLIIDPTLDFSTYLGGNSDDSGASIAVDSVGNIYVTGTTSSSNFPYVNGSYPQSGSSDNVFITKIVNRNKLCNTQNC